ncbi:MAG TPA: hypothetical protein VKZ53_08615 [Candidatus Angelobacter sp.]|nr:hypothetical protein [Candidatus Angelobacter sp.]
MALRKQFAARPRLACEITSERVIAARSSEKSPALDLFATRRLDEGVVAPGLNSPNVLVKEKLSEAIGGALASVSGKVRDVIAVLPDAAIRVVLLEFESLPTKPQECEPVIRFRLKKSLPFDVERAALSYEIKRDNGAVKVVSAVAPREVIEEYEAAFYDAGYAPGVLLPSSLASLGLVEGNRPTLLLKVDPLNVNVAAVQNQELRLIRTLDSPQGQYVSPTELAEVVLPSIAFFEDTFGSPIEHIFINGVASLVEVGPMLHEFTGARVEELSPDTASIQSLGGDQLPSSAMAGVAGALLG